MHVCEDDRPFINRIDLKFIFLDYQGNLWYVQITFKRGRVFAEVALVMEHTACVHSTHPGPYHAQRMLKKLDSCGG